MHQVLLNIPFFKSAFPPDGIPVYGFGAMLFITFVAVTVWGGRRANAIGLPPTRFQDFAIIVFVCGIIGARILYMVQYPNQFPDKSLAGQISSFFQIWKGGIVFYGSAFGGVVGYGLFYWFVMRKLNVSGWKLADAVAPLLAMGLALGRIGCYLNGCCWGQVAIEEVCPVPLGGAHFPLLPAHVRSQLVKKEDNVQYGYLQTSTGFTIKKSETSDPRSVVQAVEPGSEAEKAGIKPGDRIVKVNGEPNFIVVEVLGKPEKVDAALVILGKHGGESQVATEEHSARVFYADPKVYQTGFGMARAELGPDESGVSLTVTDYLWEQVREWPRGRENIELDVERDGEVKSMKFEPRTIGLYPTQLYETVSMVLLILVLLAYYPLRRHDGQVMVLLMLGYAIHRFINESIRVEPTYAMGLTLSQWGSVVILLAAIGLEVLLWRIMPSRWATRPQPPSQPLATSQSAKA